MITENDINNAAKDYCNKRYPASQDAPFIAEGFRKGAAWAINQVPKNKTIRIYLATLSSPGAMGVNSLDAVYAFPTMKERDRWVEGVNTHEYEVSYFEDEIEIKL